MKHHILIQKATKQCFIPKVALLRQWADAALLSRSEPAEITLRIVSLEEITMLNTQYRHKQGPTNVLSFPYDGPPELQLKRRLLGDIVICPAILEEEAVAQQKPLPAHWAHMVIHGVLHLQGYDHQNDKEASAMEALETNIMHQLGFNNPYEGK
ncbi:MAG: hypothetical protein ACD_45C00306G0001 [uncultured bacterium]|nr:MAG: hypothetical protein ACD_45C00306G0001 [uncultured bacterium]OGT56919.1 MAG: rRNA maturation RNase YbeY [Gammaproteobacteria bacterium RIFCSPHIGHO2_12_FULL_42_10]